MIMVKISIKRKKNNKNILHCPKKNMKKGGMWPLAQLSKSNEEQKKNCFSEQNIFHLPTDSSLFFSIFFFILRINQTKKLIAFFACFYV